MEWDNGVTPLERAARALCKNLTLTDDLWPQYVGPCRVVLMAAREPSEGMCKAAWTTYQAFEGFDEPEITWPLMIDAAIGEQTVSDYPLGTNSHYA